MKKNNVNKVIKGIATATVALGGASFVTEGDMVYASELDENSSAPEVESDLELLSASESSSETLTEDEYDALSEQNINDELQGEHDEMSDNAGSNTSESDIDSGASESGDETISDESVFSGSESSYGSVEGNLDEVSESDISGGSDSESVSISESESDSVVVDGSEDLIELQEGAPEQLMNMRAIPPQTAGDDQLADSEVLSEEISTSASVSESESVSLEEAMLDSELDEVVEAEATYEDTISSYNHNEYDNTITELLKAQEKTDAGFNWNNENDVAKQYIKATLLLDGAKDIKFGGWVINYNQDGTGTGDFHYIKVSFTDKDGKTREEFYDYSLIKDGKLDSDMNSSREVVYLKKEVKRDEEGNVIYNGNNPTFIIGDENEDDSDNFGIRGKVIGRFDGNNLKADDLVQSFASLSESVRESEYSNVKESMKALKYDSVSLARSESNSISQFYSEHPEISESIYQASVSESESLSYEDQMIKSEVIEELADGRLNSRESIMRIRLTW